MSSKNVNSSSIRCGVCVMSNGHFVLNVVGNTVAPSADGITAMNRCWSAATWTSPFSRKPSAEPPIQCHMKSSGNVSPGWGLAGSTRMKSRAWPLDVSGL